MTEFIDAAARARARALPYSRAFSLTEVTKGAFPSDHPPYDEMFDAGLTGVLVRPDIDEQADKIIRDARAAGLIASGSWHVPEQGEQPGPFADRVHAELAALARAKAEPTLVGLNAESGVTGKGTANDEWHLELTGRMAELNPAKLFLLIVDALQDGQFRAYYHRRGWHVHEEAYATIGGVDGSPLDPRAVLSRADENPGNARLNHVMLIDAHVPVQASGLVETRSRGFSVFLTPAPGSPTYTTLNALITPDRRAMAIR